MPCQLADVRQSLGYFDKDNTGKVDVSQISRILERLGSHKLSGSELEFVLQDRAGDFLGG